MKLRNEVKMMETLSNKEFRKKHKCKSCLYYSKTQKCIAEQICPLDINIELAKDCNEGDYL